MSYNKAFKISIPTDSDGFVGRACDAPGCKQYFKIYVPDHGDRLHCPYCGVQFPRDSLLTSSQLRYAKEAAIEEARVYVIEEFQKMMKNALRIETYHLQARSASQRQVLPQYAERGRYRVSMRRVFDPLSGLRDFGYCPGCSCENLQIYDANWANIKLKLDTEPDRDRQLRHAYGDLVSTFEVFCNRKAKRLTHKAGNFQILFDARKFFKQHANVDMLANATGANLLALRRVFQKRHVCIHAGGEITDRYVKMIPEDNSLLGTQVSLTFEELDTAATAIRVALGDLVKAIEHPG
jgi:hypothetical protein